MIWVEARVGPVAQWLEPAAHNRLVAGSSPAGPTNILSHIAGQALVAAARALLELPPHAAAKRDGIGVQFVVPAVLVAVQVLQLPRRGAGIELPVAVVVGMVAGAGIGRC